MVVSRSDPNRIEHRVFRDLPDYLTANDLLVRNRSAVLPARLHGTRDDSGGRIQGLFLKALDAHRWRVMLRSNGKLRDGQRITLRHPDHHDSPRVTITIVDRADDGGFVVRTDEDEPRDANEILADVGATPLPPYILSARRGAHDETDDDLDRDDYQTVYADLAQARSVAAPTAGLHFTPELEARLDDIPVARAEILLHVGAGTFAPVTAPRVEEHPIHSEWVSVPPDALASIDRARSRGGRSVAVGTTSVRALETVPLSEPSFTGTTNLLITPGFRFRHTDVLITNFHLPRSTLLALVGAFLGGDDPVGRLLGHYDEAIRAGYRFYSYGDAMLILP